MRQLGWWILGWFHFLICGPFFGARCDHCGYPMQPNWEDPWMLIERSGKFFDGERIVHWHDGTFPCYRCGHRIYFMDSD